MRSSDPFPMYTLSRFAYFLLLNSALLPGQDLRITIPKRTQPTPVQKLNRDGVKAIEKHDYSAAKKLFYKAYLLDPDDPFTLNNLGYMAELDGDIEGAQRFYDLARSESSDARVDASSSDSAVGRTVTQVAGRAEQSGMQINRLNIRALNLLMKDRAPEADMLLTRAHELDPKNPFTLNNLGFAKEKEGEYDAALSYYQQAASLHSDQPIVVTLNRDWRGKGISEVASQNAGKIKRLIAQAKRDRTFEASMLNLRGVSALNRNDRQLARSYFQQSYRLNPSDAFTLNNMGYVAELDGDRETAQFYYDKAQQARRGQERVDVATQKQAEGQRLAAVAEVSEAQVSNQISAEAARRHRQGPPTLLRRQPPTSSPSAQPEEQPPQQQNQPRPETQQPQPQEGPR